MELAENDEVGRFRIVRRLGGGGQGQTYEAQDTQSGKRVALKALSMEKVAEWKAVELFEREARVLAGIDHPNIPEYVDYLVEGDAFFLAQELIEGVSLEEAIERGLHVDTAEFRRIAETLLEVLVYLHGLHPPVIHRDIKPRNVIRGDDGRITLVDFGAVRDTAQTATYASTMVGTYGYMSPEQYHGESDERSDLYGLGATLVYVLSGTQPAEWPRKRLKIDFRAFVSLPEQLAAWLDRMIEPAPEDRFGDAKAALAALRAPVTRAAARTRIPFESGPPPRGSKIVVRRAGARLEIDIPPNPSRLFSAENMFLAVFTTFWLGFVAFWTAGAAAAGGLFAAFSIPFWVVGILLGLRMLNALGGGERLVLDGSKLTAAYRFLGREYRVLRPAAPAASADIRERVGAMRAKGQAPPKAIAVDAGVDTFWFGQHLSHAEKAWMAQTVDAHLRRANDPDVVLDFDDDQATVSEQQQERHEAAW